VINSAIELIIVINFLGECFMDMKRISLLLLPLITVFVNSYAMTDKEKMFGPLIEYKGEKNQLMFFVSESSDFKKNVWVYAPTKDDASGKYSYVALYPIGLAPSGPSADQDYMLNKEQKAVLDLAKENNIDENLEQGFPGYCPGDDVNNPALYLKKKDNTISCGEFYGLIKQLNKQ